MKKRTLSAALACALALTLLSACAPKEETVPTAPEQNPEQSETVQPEVPEVETPEAEEPETETPEVEEPAELVLSHTDVTLKNPGDTFTLEGSLTEKLYFGSDDETVASVDENGVVTAVAPGTTSIMVETEAGISAVCVVRCSWEEAPAEEPEQAPEELPGEKPLGTPVDLNAFVADLATRYGENFPANANVVEFGMHNDLYPGIADVNTKQLVIYQPMMGAVVCEIALAEVADAADVETVKTIFQTRINAQVDGGAWYPESIEGWQNNSRIVTNGNFVMMIAWSFCDEAVEAFNGLF